MSYDIYIQDKETGETIQFPEKHNMTGGTYCLGGTTEAWLNITYNYSPTFRRLFGEEGINQIDGKKITETIDMLSQGFEKLDNAKPDDDYWKNTDGNVKVALGNLLALASKAVYNFPDKDLVWYIC